MSATPIGYKEAFVYEDVMRSSSGGGGGGGTAKVVQHSSGPGFVDPTCAAAVDTFLSLLGAEAANMALRYQATGGVYVAGGGVVPRLLPRLFGAPHPTGSSTHTTTTQGGRSTKLVRGNGGMTANTTTVSTTTTTTTTIAAVTGEGGVGEPAWSRVVRTTY